LNPVRERSRQSNLNMGRHDFQFRTLRFCGGSIAALLFLITLAWPGRALHAEGESVLNIVYKSTPAGDLVLDLYYPEKKDPSGKTPLVVYTHGGGWATGSRNKGTGRGNIAQTVQGLVNNGFCAALVQYRLCNKDGDVRIRDCVTDSKDAVRFLAKNSDKYAIDPNRVFTFGDSAGGQIAQMLLLTTPESLPGDKELAGVPYKMIAGVSWYGPCNFEKMELFSADPKKPARDRFGARICPPSTRPEDKLRLYQEVSPVNYLAKSSPPLLMAQGDSDSTIPVHHAYHMKEKADAIGAPVEIMIIENAGHNWREADPSKPISPSTAGIVEKSVNFLTGHLGASGR
jgi:acetyl esterase/lipase